MRETLDDIRKKLQEGAYQNHEHIRLSLVARVLKKLGWNIWDPREVDAEYVPVAAEDNKKVDIALLSAPKKPAVFIEVKVRAEMIGKLRETEKQLRDYNRDLSAAFCIITDGCQWRFYYSLTSGEFSAKCFKTLDLLKDNPEDVEAAFRSFLSKREVDSGNARKQAETQLRLTNQQRAMQECLPQAHRRTQETPFPNLPEALIELVRERRFEISRAEAEEFIRLVPTARPPTPAEPRSLRETPIAPTIPLGAQTFSPERPPDLTFTKVLEATIGSKTAKNWSGLVNVGIRLAIQEGHSFDALRNWLTTQVKQGNFTIEGFHPIPQTGLSVQYSDANKAWQNALIFAKKLGLELRVRFSWRRKEGAAHPGEEAVLHWFPQ